MTLKKKLLAAVAALIAVAVVAAVVIYVLYGRDHYDPSKYTSEISDGLQVGGTISFTLPDQFDVSHTIGAEVKVLVVAGGRTASRAAKEYFDKQASDFLATRSAMLVIDISAAPTVIRNKFMLPKLREASYPIVLIYEKAIAEKLTNPTRGDDIAIIGLENNVVRKVTYATSDEELASALSE